MKTISTLLLILLCAILLAQTGDGTASVRAGGKTWTFTLLPVVASFTCDKTALAPGETSVLP